MGIDRSLFLQDSYLPVFCPEQVFQFCYPYIPCVELLFQCKDPGLFFLRTGRCAAGCAGQCRGSDLQELSVLFLPFFPVEDVEGEARILQVFQREIRLAQIERVLAILPEGFFP